LIPEKLVSKIRKDIQRLYQYNLKKIFNSIKYLSQFICNILRNITFLNAL